jgi:hypothetical protein
MGIKVTAFAIRRHSSPVMECTSLESIAVINLGAISNGNACTPSHAAVLNV